MYIDREDFSTRLNLLDQIKRSENYGVTYINYMNMIGKAFQTTYQEALEMDKDYEIRNLIDSVLLIRELSVFVNELNQYLSQPTLFDREIMFGELDQFMMDLNNNQYLLIDLVSPSETVVIAERKKYKVYCPSVMPDTVTLFDPVIEMIDRAIKYKIPLDSINSCTKWLHTVAEDIRMLNQEKETPIKDNQDNSISYMEKYNQWKQQ